MKIHKKLREFQAESQISMIPKEDYAWESFWGTSIHNANHATLAHILVYHLGQKLSEGSLTLISSSEIYNSIQDTVPDEFLDFFKNYLKRNLAKVYRKYDTSSKKEVILFNRNEMKTKWSLSPQGAQLYHAMTNTPIPTFKGNATSQWLNTLNMGECRMISWSAFDRMLSDKQRSYPLGISFEDLHQQYILKIISTNSYVHYLDYLYVKSRIKELMFGMIFVSYVNDVFRKIHKNKETHHETKGSFFDISASELLDYHKTDHHSWWDGSNEYLQFDSQLIENSRTFKKLIFLEKHRAYSVFQRKYGEDVFDLLGGLFDGYNDTELVSRLSNVNLNLCKKVRQDLNNYLDGLALKYEDNVHLITSFTY